MRQRSIESVGKLDARKPRDLNLPEFLIDQNKFDHFFHNLLYNKKNMVLIAVRQKVKSIDNSVAVHEIKLVLNITRL